MYKYEMDPVSIVEDIERTQIHPQTHKQTSCAHKWGQYTPTLITTHLIQKYPIKTSILQLCATEVGILQENFVPEEFRHHFSH